MSSAVERLSELAAASSGGRRAAVEAAAAGLRAVDPRALVRRALDVEGSSMVVGGRTYHLDSYGRVFVLGGGKASGLMAVGLEETLGDRLGDGAVVVPDYQAELPRLRHIEFIRSTHPLPTEAGIRAVNRMLEVGERAKEGDLVLCLVSGGGSSLMPSPVHGLRLDELRRTTGLLLSAGASIGEINCVRKHLSEISGGRLVQKLGGAEVLALVVSDVVGDDLGSVASGPTSPDPTTFADAREVLQKYGIWEEGPSEVSALIARGARGEIEETPKPGGKEFAKVTNVVVGSNATACEAAAVSLRGAGFEVDNRIGVIGEAKVVGSRLASEARGERRAVVWGGETTVTVRGRGKGGRNQEVALSAAVAMQNDRGTTALAIGTDGIDGPTDAAGAIADSGTCARARKLGSDPDSALAENDSYHFFRALGDLIVTGPTGTNVTDLMILVRE